MVVVNPSSSGVPAAGSSFTITCVALKSASGFSQSPQVSWTSPSGGIVTSGGGLTLASPMTDSLRTTQALTFDTLSTAEAGVYTCDASLSSSALTSPYQTNETHTVQVSGESLHINNTLCFSSVFLVILYAVPTPRITLTSNTGQYISDNTVIFTCTITLASTVNSGEMVSTSWSGPNGQLINSSSVTLSNVRSIASESYQSSLTITGFVPAVHNGNYRCNGSVTSMSSYVTGTSTSATTSVMISGTSFIFYRAEVYLSGIKANL